LLNSCVESHYNEVFRIRQEGYFLTKFDKFHHLVNKDKILEKSKTKLCKMGKNTHNFGKSRGHIFKS
jgi:hypothetical protein